MPALSSSTSRCRAFSSQHYLLPTLPGFCTTSHKTLLVCSRPNSLSIPTAYGCVLFTHTYSFSRAPRLPRLRQAATTDAVSGSSLVKNWARGGRWATATSARQGGGFQEQPATRRYWRKEGLGRTPAGRTCTTAPEAAAPGRKGSAPCIYLPSSSHCLLLLLLARTISSLSSPCLPGIPDLLSSSLPLSTMGSCCGILRASPHGGDTDCLLHGAEACKAAGTGVTGLSLPLAPVTRRPVFVHSLCMLISDLLLLPVYLPWWTWSDVRDGAAWFDWAASDVRYRRGGTGGRLARLTSLPAPACRHGAGRRGCSVLPLPCWLSSAML